MARRRKKRRRNPSTAQWVALGVGGVVGLGLVGYGIHLTMKNRRGAKQISGAEGTNIVEWKYSIAETGGADSPFVVTIYGPDGTKTELDNYSTEAVADDAARSFILVRGGVPVRVPVQLQVVTGLADLL